MKKLAIVVSVSIAISCAVVFFGSDKDHHRPQTNGETLEAQRQDAERRIRSEWKFSEFAKERMPAIVAAGEWSSSQNIWDCNIERFDCVEVDFDIPKNDIKARWVVSYDRGSMNIYGVRTFNNATETLFQRE